MIENVACPVCGDGMVSRKNGATGQRFWGCLNYPRCRGTRDTDGEAPRQRPDAEPSDERGLPSDRARENDRRRHR